jgi:hypothetical protein
MRMRVRMRRAGGAAWILGVCVGLPLQLAPAAAVVLDLDPSRSSLTPSAGPVQSLSGAIAIQTGAEPPLASNTTFDVTGLAVATSGGQSIGLDPAISNPGAGVLSPSGNFLIPNLFLRLVDGVVVFDLSVPNVTGRYGALAGCPVALCLSTDFAIDTGGPQGIIQVDVFAQVPEPSSFALVAAALIQLAALRRARARATR